MPRVGSVGRKVFFFLFFSCKKGRNALKLIISTRNRHTMNLKTIKKLKKVRLTSVVEIIVVFKSLSAFH